MSFVSGSLFHVRIHVLESLIGLVRRRSEGGEELSNSRGGEDVALVKVSRQLSLRYDQ